MGVWGIGILDNEVACQLAVALEDFEDLRLIEETFERVLTVDRGWLDEADCEAGLAAAEVIARLQGNCNEKNPCAMLVDNWIVGRNIDVSPKLAKKAVRVVNRILSERSDLMESWKITGLFEAWKKDVENLRSRIRI